jgi:predicted Zn-ribbon and HTH transcriptional regulator
MKSTTIQGHECQRCGHITVTRDGTVPKRCGACKSPYWSRPKSRLTKTTLTLRCEECGKKYAEIDVNAKSLATALSKLRRQHSEGHA